MTENKIIEAAKKWHDIRKTMFAKEKSDTGDWSILADAEHALMRAVAECQ